MSMRGNLLTGAYLKTIAASFLARMLVGFRGIPGIALAPTSRRSAKPNTGKRNQYAIGSELVESFFHLGFKPHASTKTPQHWRFHNRTLNRWLRYVGRTFFNFPRHRKFVWCRFREQT
jgi:hypothetical protein